MPALAVIQRVGEGLASALRQQHDAEHGEHSEGGEDDVVQKVAGVVLELHQRGGGNAYTARREHQAQTATPGGGRSEEGRRETKEGR